MKIKWCYKKSASCNGLNYGPKSNGDNDGGDDDEEAIFGYDIITILAVIGCVAVVLIKKWYKEIK